MNNINYYRIEKALKFIDDNFRTQPSLQEIAEHIGLSEFHFQKTFKKWAGISPKKFLQYLTTEYCKSILKDSQSIFETTYESGLSSTSRLHDHFISIEAITPAEYLSLGNSIEISYGQHSTPFGKCFIALTKKGICMLTFVEDKVLALEELKKKWPKAAYKADSQRTKRVLEDIFSNRKKAKINLFVKGTNFQIQVWKALLEIPEGKLTTYEKIAQKINNPKAVRAVGTAIGNNQISYLIPCHRVINKMGVIGNYRWGRARKKAILGREMSNLNS